MGRTLRLTEVFAMSSFPIPGEDMVIAGAAAVGFALVEHEGDNGQLLWEWRHGDEPAPQFVSRRVAMRWMREWLERRSALAS